MIYIRIEMWPKGDRESARLLGEATLTNVGGNATHGDYEVALLKSPEYASARNIGKPWRKGTVKAFPRKSLGPWDLLLRALVVTCGSRSRGYVNV